MKSIKYLSARQAAQELGVSKAYACRLFANGVIPAEKVDTDWIVQRKDIQAYLYNKAGIPLYYRSTEGWSQREYYFLFRSLDRMLHSQNGRYSEELASIKVKSLNACSKALLAAMGAYRQYPNLKSLKNAKPLSPPLVLTDYPSFGSFPQFEKYGVVL